GPSPTEQQWPCTRASTGDAAPTPPASWQGPAGGWLSRSGGRSPATTRPRSWRPRTPEPTRCWWRRRAARPQARRTSPSKRAYGPSHQRTPEHGGGLVAVEIPASVTQRDSEPIDVVPVVVDEVVGFLLRLPPAPRRVLGDPRRQRAVTFRIGSGQT